MKKNTFVVVMLAIILVVSVGLTELYVVCNSSQKTKDKFQIVTSFYPMYVACANLTEGMEDVEVINLSEPQTGCLHDYAPTTEDMRTLSTADVFVINGAGMESFMEGILEEYPNLPVIESAEGIILLEDEHEHESHEEADHEEHEEADHEEHEDADHEEHEEADHEEHEEADHEEHEEADHEEHEEADHEENEEADHDEHEHGHEHNHNHEGNGHVWMSVTDYSMQVENIAHGLMELDAKNATAYERNLANYQNKLAKLMESEQELRKEIEGQEVIVLHEAYEYLTEELGLEVVACANLDEPDQVSAFSPAKRAEMIELIKERDIKIILVEEKYGRSIAEAIAKECQVELVYLDTCNRGDFAKDSYLDAMTENIAAIEKAIKNSIKMKEA